MVKELEQRMCKMTVECGGKKLTIEFDSLCDIEEYVDAFKTILKFQTFSSVVYDNIFADEYRDIPREENV